MRCWSTPTRIRLHQFQLADRKSTRLNSSHSQISYAVFCLKKKTVTGVQTCADRKSTRLNSSHSQISYAVFCLKKKTNFMDILMSRKSHLNDCVTLTEARMSVTNV